MKGIECCGECAYYNMKTHKCTGGAKDAGKETDSFYADCPREEAKPVRHGRWIDKPNPKWRAYDIRHCSECGWNIPKSKLRIIDEWNYCPNCGAHMDAGNDQGGADE